MRLSGLVIFIVLIATIGFVYLGFSEPQLSFKTQINLTAPVDVAYDTFTDTASMSVWVADLARVDLLRGTPGTADSFYRMSFVTDGEDVVATMHLVALESGTRAAYDIEFPYMDNSVEVLFEPFADGTRIATYNTVRGKGLYWRAMLRLQKGSLIEKQLNDYGRLKDLVESR